MGVVNETSKNQIEYDETLLDIPPINEHEIKKRAKILEVSKSHLVTGEHRTAWLLKAVTCIDLTTLAGDDTKSNVLRLCVKALNPIRRDILDELGLPRNFDLTCAAVCVYPARVSDAAEAVSGQLPIASVATGFPAGQTSLETRLGEIHYAVESGASEIDIVINRSYAIAGDWKLLYDELREMKNACGPAHMKAILAVGELPDFTFVYKASMVAMCAGADFIKTSTGKEPVNATIPVGLVMCRAIRNYYAKTSVRIGLKPAGGIRVAQDAINWLILIKEELGTDWLNKDLFRIGASGLLTDIEQKLYTQAFGRNPPPNLLSIA